MLTLVFLCAAYLTGSIPFGLVLTRLAGIEDIRKIGSGNIGATNVLRTGHKGLALATLILDAGKGGFFILFIRWFAPHADELNFYTLPADLSYALYGLAAILGHCFPVWLGFKGGKGVATTFGTLLAATPWAGLIAAALWLMTAAIFRYSSLAALVAVSSAPFTTFYFYGYKPALIIAAIAVLVFYFHKANIERLRKGEETKINFNKTKKA